MESARYDSGGVYTSPDGKCANCITGTYHACRGGAPLTRCVVIKLDVDDTVFCTKPINIGTDLHEYCVVRAVNGTPWPLFLRRFDVPLVDARPDDPEPVVAIRRALRRGLVIEFAGRKDAESAPLNRWFRPEAKIRGPVSALLVFGYSADAQ